MLDTLIPILIVVAFSAIVLIAANLALLLAGWLLRRLGLGTALTALIGRVTWEVPRWLTAIGRLLRAGAVGLRRPRNAAIAAAVVVVAIGAYAAWSLWPRPPPPIQVSFAVSTPTPPPPRRAADPVPPPDPLRISFSGSAAPLERIGKTWDVSADLGVTLKPELPGTWQWTSDTTLVFSPGRPWPVGEKYELEVAAAAIAEHVELAEDSATFAIQAFSANLASAEFYQDPTDPKIKQVVGTVRFNYPVEPQSLEPVIAMVLTDPLTRQETPYRFTVTYDDLKFEAFVRSEVVAVPLEDQNMLIKVKAGVRAQAGGAATSDELAQEVRIPGRSNLFRINQTLVTLVRNAEYDPEQVLVIDCSSGVSEPALAKAVSAWVLPIDKPAVQGKKAVKSYGWGNAAEIGPEILKFSKKLALTTVPAEREIATQHTYKLEAPPERHLFVRIEKGVEAYGGYNLAKTYEDVLFVPAYPREVRIMHDGALLAVGGDRKLNVMVRGLPAVRIDLARVLPRNINHLVSQSAGDFRNPYFQNYLFNEENVAEVFSEVRRMDAADPRRAQFTAVDFAAAMRGGDEAGQNRGLFLLNVRAWDPDKDAPANLERPARVYRPVTEGEGDGGEGEGEGEGEGYQGEGDGEGYEGEGSREPSFDQATDRRFVLVTDLGLLVKTDVEQSQVVFVQSIQTGEPVADAVVEVLGKNGLSVLTRRTDADGTARFPTLKDFVREKQPVAYVARQGDDLSFLPLARGDRLLGYSRFDVGGTRTRGQADALAAFLFSDRGIYRPGDAFNVGVMVKPVDWTREVGGVPVQLVVTDPRGLEIKRRSIELPASGFVELTYATEESAPTGTYSVTAYIMRDDKRAGVLGATTVRVEEFLPDRLRITSRIVDAPEDGWVSPESVRARVELQNLFGTPAIGHRVAASMTLQPRFPAFRSLRDYTFYDPSRAEQSYEERLQDVTTDDEGVALFDLDLSNMQRATYQLSFFAQGFELDGGRGVSSEVGVLVSPLDFLVGYKADGDLGFIKKDGSRAVELIAIDAKLAKTEVKKLSAVLIEQRWVSVLQRQPNGNYAYASVLKEITKSEKPLTIAAKGTPYALPTAEPGTFVLAIRDDNDTELTRIPFTVAGEANLSRELERNAELQIALDRRDYQPGDMITVQIKAPYVGGGLLTIERDKVYAYKWFRTTTTTSVQTIEVPAGLEGNGYVNVAFVRGLESEEIYMSPLSYGVAPFSVDRKSRTVAIELSAPDKVKPGDKLKIDYQTDRPAKIVVWGADEGILQVARYATPDPLSFFLSKRALEVLTWQILDLILPEYSVVRALAKEGGDEMEALAKNLNPFKRKREKPVAFWSGILDAGPEAKSYFYTVPDTFNGTMRLMAVAVSTEAMGAATTRTVVRGPFVLSPNTPLFVGPEDTFEASVAIANNVEGSGKDAKVEVGLTVTGGLEVVGEATKTVTIAEGREAAVRFEVKAKPELGNAEMKLTAKTGKQVSKLTATTSVRPATPFLTTVRSGSVKDGSVDLPVDRRLFEPLSRLELGVSPLPLGLARGLAAYLETYPYLCSEQLMSAAVPALVLSRYKGLGYEPKQAKESWDRALAILAARQNEDGAFGFWAANASVSDATSLYIAHMLTEAGDAGQPVPGGMLSRSLGFVREVVRRPITSLADARQRAYGIYILARNAQLATAELAELAQVLRRDYADAWPKDITALWVAAAHQLVRDEAEAKKAIKTSALAAEVALDEERFYDTQSYLAQYLFVVARHFPGRLEDLDTKLLERLSAGIASQSYTTHSAAWSILALDAYAKAVTGGKRDVLAKVTVEEVREKNATEALKLGEGLFPVVRFSHAAKALRIKNAGDLPVFYALTVGGFDREAPAAATKAGLELIHSYEDSNGKPVTQVAMGDTVRVRLKIRSLARPRVANVAIVDLLPAGFDVVLDQGAGGGLGGKGGSFALDYVDAREDRVVAYGTVTTSVSDFVYDIKAVSRGQFKVPPAFAEAMYDRSLSGRSLAAALTVVGE